jgi:hypothetical protein
MKKLGEWPLLVEISIQSLYLESMVYTGRCLKDIAMNNKDCLSNTRFKKKANFKQ